MLVLLSWRPSTDADAHTAQQNGDTSPFLHPPQRWIFPSNLKMLPAFGDPFCLTFQVLLFAAAAATVTEVPVKTAASAPHSAVQLWFVPSLRILIALFVCFLRKALGQIVCATNSMSLCLRMHLY